MLLLLSGRKGTSTPLLLPFWKGTSQPPIDRVILLRVPSNYEFPVQLRDRVDTLFPSFDEMRKIGINAGGSRAWLLFWKRAMAQPA
jgi:hypothetical protein